MNICFLTLKASNWNIYFLQQKHSSIHYLKIQFCHTNDILF